MLYEYDEPEEPLSEGERMLRKMKALTLAMGGEVNL